MMWQNRANLFGAIILLGLVAFFSGCGNDEDESCSDVICPSGQQCRDGVCGGSDGSICEPGCQEGEYCQSRRCVSDGGGCDNNGQACRRSQYGQYFDEFLCMDWVSQGQNTVCSQDCRDQPCPDGGACFLVTLSGGGTCEDDSTCAEGQFCYQGGCAYAACRPAECVRPGGLDDACDSGERCEATAAGTNLCVPAGTREVGDSCIDGASAFEENRLGESCVSDAVCVGGACREYCDEGECSNASDECVPVGGPGGGANEIYACVSSCDFGAQQTGCSEGESCVPTEGGSGVCQAAGSLEAFAECTVGGEGCEVGLICAGDESGEVYGRCLPICDLSVGQPGDDGRVGRSAQDARDATCPQVEPGEGAWGMWHLAEAVGAMDLYLGDEVEPVAQIGATEMADFDGELFQRREQGQVSWALRGPGSAATDVPVVEGEFALGSGQVKLIVVVPEAGRDSALESEDVDLSAGASASWIQGIPDLPPVDLWAVDEEDTSVLVLENFTAGELREGPELEGIYELRLLEVGAGEEEESLLSYPGIELGIDARLIAFRGTMDTEDLHPTLAPVISSAGIPDVVGDAPLETTCRAVNGGSIGGCMEACGQGGGLVTGRCQGEQMGCGPRFQQNRVQWTTVCQPVGESEEGEGCDPRTDTPCGEGLYCEEYGTGASAGICAPLCTVGNDEMCGEAQGCRPVAYGTDYGVGECRTKCEPDGSYFDATCPDGLQRCKPESSLMPVGDAYDIRVEQPFCWASGETEVGSSCFPGGCVPGSECLYERSQQTDFTATLLSPYFGGAGGALPLCREICDPFLGEGAEFQCEEGETCLFNYPWNANVGHCAEIVEEREQGESCDQPGMACGEDSICVMEQGGAQCVQFCQFIGGGASGYERSTCPVGFQCGPYVSDIGVCRSS